MGRLSLSLFFGYHDSSVTVANDKSILLHLEAERLFREKHCRITTLDRMDELAASALKYVGGNIEDVDRLYLAKLGNRLSEEQITISGRTFKPIITTHHNNHIGTVLDHGFEKTLIVVADGGSEDGSTRIYLHDSDGTITMLEDLNETVANGKFYGSLTMMVIDPDFLKAHGWYSGKTMGLSAYGTYSDKFESLLQQHTPKMLWGNVLDVPASRKLFGLSDDYSRPWLDSTRKNLAHTGQKYWANCFVEALKKHRHHSENIVMVGGCALNVLLNSELIDSGLFKRIHVGPASGDGGQSLGAILYHERDVRCEWPYLGRGFGDLDSLPDKLVPDLLGGKLVAWYQGRSEIGPRALGHRSLLGLPNSVEQRDRMNRLKRREPYRPVAPMVTEEALEQFFETTQPSPYMSFAPKAKEITYQIAPAIIHADGTCRVQTLTPAQNPILHQALVHIGKETGAPILMNTSFNFAGEAMVDTPDDAIRSFKVSGMDVLYINGERITRESVA
jgi:carbamoyltransferase